MKTRTPGVALLAALALDNFGSGLFVPYLLLYVQSSGGWDLAAASRLLGVGTVVALLVPAREHGPRRGLRGGHRPGRFHS